MFLEKYIERIHKLNESQQEYIKKNVVPILNTYVNDMEKEQVIDNERAKQHELNEKDYKNKIDLIEQKLINMKKQIDSNKRKRAHEIDTRANMSYDRRKIG